MSAKRARSPSPSSGSDSATDSDSANDRPPKRHGKSRPRAYRKQQRKELKRPEWDEAWRELRCDRRRNACRRALGQLRNAASRQSDGEGEALPEPTGDKSSIRVTKGGSWTEAVAYVPTMYTITTPENPVRRSTIFSPTKQSSRWKADLADWSFNQDLHRQMARAFVEKTLSMQSPSLVRGLYYKMEDEHPHHRREEKELLQLLKDCGKTEEDVLNLVENHLAVLYGAKSPMCGEFFELCRMCGNMGCARHLASMRRSSEVPKRKGLSEPCGEDCVYSAVSAQREVPMRDWARHELETLCVALRTFGFAPCRVASAFDERDCVEVDTILRSLEENDPSLDVRIEANFLSSLRAEVLDIRRLATTVTIMPIPPSRPYYPKMIRQSKPPCDCEDHEHSELASVCKQSMCRCANSGNYCDRLCACSKHCPIRYDGCDCDDEDACDITSLPIDFIKGEGPRFRTSDSQCRCVRESRECDPDVCGRCGADEHPHDVGNKWNCGNQSMLRRLAQQMVIRDSPLHGRGAFLTAAVKKGTYLGEYTGDLIGPEEADRRDDAMGADTVYLFDMDNTANGSHLMIDARTKGNKTRYINEDSNGTANCFFHVKVALGEYRCGVYAARDIAANEELLVSYGAKFSARYGK